MIIITDKYGQLGNRLIRSAHLIAAAKEHGTCLMDPMFAPYASYFKSTRNSVFCRYPVRKSLRSSEKPSRLWQRRLAYHLTRESARMTQKLTGPRLASRFIHLQDGEVYDLNGSDFRTRLESSAPLWLSGFWFRSETLLQTHQNEVRRHFRISSKHQAPVDRRIAEARQSGDRLVGIHIRHGDYQTWQGGRYFFPVSKYVQWMRSICEQLGGKTQFLVCGNADLDPDQFAGLNVHFGPGHMVEDLYALAATDWLVGPPSTFSLWASFYGNVPLTILESADQTIDANSDITSTELVHAA
ncbi:O-fucosyltransferase family protein [Rubripirellula lacrimiformis]|nr:hypothetical protein [Rubripirellula lacrimiformis]